MKIGEPKPPGTLWATPGLLWDSFTFFLTPYVVEDLQYASIGNQNIFGEGLLYCLATILSADVVIF